MNRSPTTAEERDSKQAGQERREKSVARLTQTLAEKDHGLCHFTG